MPELKSVFLVMIWQKKVYRRTWGPWVGMIPVFSSRWMAEEWLEKEGFEFRQHYCDVKFGPWRDVYYLDNRSANTDRGGEFIASITEESINHFHPTLTKFFKEEGQNDLPRGAGYYRKG